MGVIERHHRLSNPWTLNAVQEVYRARGCVLLEPNYTHSHAKLRYQCPAGHIHANRFSQFLEGHGCPTCRNARRWEGRRTNLESVKQVVEAAGLRDVQVWRSNGHIRVKYTCGCGRRKETGYQHFRRGSRCRACVFAKTRGAAHYNFNPGLTAVDRTVGRKFNAYAQWRRDVFHRDLYACMRCGAHGGSFLVAHHLRNYREAPALRLDVTNGVTLCEGCHTAFHRAKGYRGNTPAQFREWLKESRS